MIGNLFRRSRVPCISGARASWMSLASRSQVPVTRRFFAQSDAENKRETFQEYWQSDHSAPTIENMMLDSDAGSMDLLDRPEILAELPSLSGKKVLELGAGIGRFSAPLALKAESVVAVDFVAASCAENRRLNADKSNLEVICGDATQIDFPTGSFDLVFSNWLLMYLTDDELARFAQKSLEWLTPGGHVFFRESCFHSSGDAKRRFNPTQYRSPEEYAAAFTKASLESGCRFQLKASSCVDVYAQVKGNVHQMWFRYEKISSDVSSRQIKFLRTGQYSQFKVLRYESVYGENHIEAGGEEMTKILLDTCKGDLAPGSRLLAIGCGLGGAMLHMAEKCPGAYFHGVSYGGELAAIAIGRHVRRPREIRDRVSFEVVSESGVPANELTYPPNLFNVILHHNNLMHINLEDKGVLLRKTFRLLRPGGKCLIVDYCRGKPIEESSEDFRNYLDVRGYTLLTPEEELKQLELYFQVEMLDLTADFSRFLETEMGRIETHYGTANAVDSPPDEIMQVLKSKLEQHVMETLKGHSSSLAEDAVVAEDAARAAMEKVGLHIDAALKDAERQSKNYKWLKEFWDLKQRAVAAGELKYVLFVATKKGEQ